MASIGQKEIRTDWDEQTEDDSSKRIGHKTTLFPTKGSLVPRRNKRGLK